VLCAFVKTFMMVVVVEESIFEKVGRVSDPGSLLLFVDRGEIAIAKTKV